MTFEDWQMWKLNLIEWGNLPLNWSNEDLRHSLQVRLSEIKNNKRIGKRCLSGNFRSDILSLSNLIKMSSEGSNRIPNYWVRANLTKKIMSLHRDGSIILDTRGCTWSRASVWGRRRYLTCLYLSDIELKIMMLNISRRFWQVGFLLRERSPG